MAVDVTSTTDAFIKGTLLPTALKTEFQKTDPDVYLTLELGLPGGTKRYGMQGVTWHGVGMYEPKLLGVDSLGRGINLGQNSLGVMEMGVTIDDTDYEFAQILEGSSGNSVRRSAATVRLVTSSGVSFPYFVGLIDSYDQVSPLVWKINLRPNDLPLQRKFPKVRITKFDWPNLDPDIEGQYTPILYGAHSSVGLAAEGMMPTLYVDTVGFRYLIALGYMKQVGAVYVDGAATASSNYAITYPVINGNQYTLIDFTSDQGTSIITCDCEGYEDVGDGSGTLIANPVKQIEHCLNNFIYGDYRTGTWAARGANAPIDEPLFDIAAAFANKEGYEGANYQAAQVKGIDYFNNWLKSWELQATWTNGGNIAPIVLDHTKEELYVDDPWIRWEQHELEYRQQYDTTKIVDKLQGRYLYNSASGQYGKIMEVEDPTIDEEAVETIDMTHGTSRLV